MVEQDKRPRGRPKGSCLDDAATLSRIADLLVSGEKSSKTAAIRRIAGPDPSVVRRLQRKFRDAQPALMNAAWGRAHARGIAVTTNALWRAAGAETAAGRGLWPDAAVGRPRHLVPVRPRCGRRHRAVRRRPRGRGLEPRHVLDHAPDPDAHPKPPARQCRTIRYSIKAFGFRRRLAFVDVWLSLTFDFISPYF